LKVLHFYKTYYPDTFGGIEQVIYQLSEAGISYGISSITFSLSKRGNIDNQLNGSHYSNYANTTFELASTPFSISAINKFRRLAEQVDVIHYHFPFPFMDMLHFLCGIKKPSVVSYHSDIVKQKLALKIYTPLMDQFLKSVDCIVAASPNYAQSSFILNKYQSKVKIIPYGLDKTSYPMPDDERKNFWKNAVGDNFFLFIGAFRYYKGLHILLEAMAGIDYPLVIVGTGLIDDELRELVTVHNLKNVHFVGAISDENKVALLELCYCVVFPSHLRSEAFGITLLEGAMYGKPLISCEIGTGTSFINIHKETGLVVKPNDALDLRHAMTKIWEDPVLAKNYGIKAFERYEATFTADLMMEKYMNIYKELINKNN